MAGMKNVLKQIPKGWELVPVGCVLTTTCKVCVHPHNKWEFVGADGPIGCRVNNDVHFIPHGYYIHKKRVKARK